MVNSTALIILFLTYLVLIFGIASVVEKGLISTKITRSPWLHTLAQTSFISAWGYYGIYSLSYEYGYGSLAYFLGSGALLLFAPFLLLPLSKIASQHQLNSFADLGAFRFPDSKAGVIITVILLLSALPLLALQVTAVADTSQIIFNGEHSWFFDYRIPSLSFTVLTVTFALIFGAGRNSFRGMTAALAVESILKLAGIITIGLVALYWVFDGPSDLSQWLELHPVNRNQLYPLNSQNNTPLLVLVFMSGALLVPHAFNYNNGRQLQIQVLKRSSWFVPLYLLVMAMPIFPIIWAADIVGTPWAGTNFVSLGLAISTQSPWVLAIVAIGGLSAATGTTVVMLLTTANMSLNQLVLPRINMPSDTSLYKWLAHAQKTVIILIGVAALGFSYILKHASYTELAVTAFQGTVQLLPLLFAITLWPEAKSRAVIPGIIAGAVVWLITAFIPLILNMNIPLANFSWGSIGIGPQFWQSSLSLSFGLNLITTFTLGFIVDSSETEQKAAIQCQVDKRLGVSGERLIALSPQAMIEALSPALGHQVAHAEVRRALKTLGMTLNERKSSALIQLRNQLESNLSGLMGHVIASEVISDTLPVRKANAEQTDLIDLESHIDQRPFDLPGLAGEVDRLRRYHRSTLEQLPMGVFTMSEDFEVGLWNSTLANLTDISSIDARGTELIDLPQPWGETLANFATSGNNYQRTTAQTPGGELTLDLHKARRGSEKNKNEQRIIVVEDRTEIETLHRELIHKERLSSIGRLAAGVAHEIGNPVTGIACLAQELEQSVDKHDIKVIGEEIQIQTKRITQIVQSLVNFSHPGSSLQDAQRVNLNHCVGEAKKLLLLQTDKKLIDFNITGTSEAYCYGDETKLIQVFVNLLSNARDASLEYSTVRIDIKVRREWIFIHVLDEGDGIAQEHLSTLFDPFFTTKEVGAGTGLGLALVYNIVREHGGEIEVNSAPNQGAEFIVSLPFAQLTETPLL